MINPEDLEKAVELLQSRVNLKKQFIAFFESEGNNDRTIREFIEFTRTEIGELERTMTNYDERIRIRN